MSLEATVMEFKEYLNRMLSMAHMVSFMHYELATEMPDGAKASWLKKISTVRADIFAMQTSDRLAEMLSELGKHESELDEITRCMYQSINRDFEKDRRVPKEFMREYGEALGQSQLVWQKAKRENDFASFAPYLKANIENAKKLASYIDPNRTAFDVLLEESEPGMSSKELDPYFAKMKEHIVPLLKKVMASEVKIDEEFMSRHVPVETQKKISKVLMKAIGYDINRGQIRETEHPFCSSYGRNDARITTHYYEDRFMSSFFSVLHECGHAMYEQNKMEEIADTILDRGATGAMHESQSRFYENVVGRSREFIGYVFDDIKKLLGEDFSDLTADKLYLAANAAHPGLIRIEADELTYSLHIMVRYELERMFLSEDIDVNELPRLWNEKIKEYLGVDVPNDARGILQDVHWSQGLIGYFPSYSLGSAYAAQFAHYIKKEVNLSSELARGNIAAVTGWLMSHLQQYGQMYLPAELMLKATGEKFNPDYYINYLTDKFTEIYKL